MTTAAVVGTGHSGLRFLRACLSLKPEQARIVGICDRDERKLDALKALFPCASRDFRSLAEWGPIDLIIVTTSEREHFEVISFVKEHAQFRRLICEKPLCATTAEAYRLRELLDEDDLAINFVERHSLAVSTLKRFIIDHQRRVVRVNFSWGKFRIKDPRETLGVVSELCHPIDLSLFLAGVPPGTGFQILSASGVSSDFSVGTRAFDSMSLSIRFGSDLLITGCSSYIRPFRERQLELLLADHSQKVRELATIRFDDPRWDDDHLQVFEIDSPAARPPLVLEYKTAFPGFDGQTHNLRKLSHFLSLNIAEISGDHSPDLAKIHQGVYVQQVLEEATNCAALNRISFSGFTGHARAFETSIDQKCQYIHRLVSSDELPTCELMWDDGY